MEKHLKVCSKRGHATLPYGRKIENESSVVVAQLSSIEENLMSLRRALNEEIQMRHEMLGELGGLKRRNQVSQTQHEPAVERFSHANYRLQMSGRLK